jgi:molybdopterin converting factor small subunit
MHVRVKLFASLRRFAGDAASGTPLDVELPDGATLSDLCHSLHLPANEVKLTFVNGRVQPEDWRLQPKDEVGIFPPVGGG